jgi:hypothetical protein
VTLYGLDLVVAGKSTVAVHDKSYMLRHCALPDRGQKQLADVLNNPFRGRRLEDPFPQMRDVQ